MKSAAARDRMIARVNETFAKWPSFDDVPETKAGGDMRIDAQGDQPTYVQGLYAICAHGEVTGRSGSHLVGKNVADPDEDVVEAKPRKGRVLNTRG